MLQLTNIHGDVTVQYRRLTIRYERESSHFLAFLGLAAALTCYKKLAKAST